MQCDLYLHITPTNPRAALAFTVKLGSQTIYSTDHVMEPAHIHASFVDDPAVTQVLTLTMSGKQREHTRIDAQGNILSDALLRVDEFAIDGFDCMPLLLNHASYEHDFNGTGDLIQDEFWPLMGCNGTVRLEISGGVYAMLCNLTAA